jgi:hypothetical protein
VCLSGYCICFTHTLHVFYLNVAYGCNGFQVFFRCFFQMFLRCFFCFISMFQVFNCVLTYVATVVFGCFKIRSGVASLFPTSAASSRCVLLPAPASESEALHPSPSCRLVARVVRALHGAREIECSTRAFGRPSARTTVYIAPLTDHGHSVGQTEEG